MPYDMSMQGSYHLPAQGWDRWCEDAAVRRLRGASAGPALCGRRASWRRLVRNQLVLAEQVATELTGLCGSIIWGVCLLYVRRPVHLLGEGSTAFGPKAPVFFTPVLYTGVRPKKETNAFFTRGFVASHASSLYTARIAGLRTELPPVTHAHFHVHGCPMPCTGVSFQQLGARAYF